jgi:hypothetical protein
MSYKRKIHKGELLVPIKIVKVIVIAQMFCFLSQRSYATQTMECFWHCGYFNVIFVDNYGTGDREGERYTQDVVKRVNVVMELDNLLRNQRREGKLEHFNKWILVDHYMGSYGYNKGRKVPKQIRIEKRKVFLCLTDSNSINNALDKLWNMNDAVVSPNRQSGMWLFSLHVGLSKTRMGARPFPHGGYIDKRPDSNLLWLKCEGDATPHHWYQHEKDGYYHQYTGLYLTRENVLKAQELLLENCNLNTSITSHYLTPAIVRKYVGGNF